ncbi:MAG: thioredoxin-dependent thiol peroxidase [Bacteroidia bacterium]|jgi:peroxiredoxin Q/BCP|nr:thioredoxin-dependent thiol peroxidase [Bacteroidia bacterium]
MKKLAIGDKAPAIDGVLENGNSVSLNDFKGKKLVLYFYPKDDTPGCTAEACDLRDNYNRFIDEGYAIIGVSPDSEKKHLKFIDKYDLPFSLIADTEKTVCENYGVWVEKSMYGRQYMGVARSTFIIDGDGFIETIIEKVKTKEHAAQILD